MIKEKQEYDVSHIFLEDHANFTVFHTDFIILFASETNLDH